MKIHALGLIRLAVAELSDWWVRAYSGGFDFYASRPGLGNFLEYSSFFSGEHGG